MKIRYFFGIYLCIVFGSSRGNVFDDFLAGAKKWWKSLTAEKREKMREGVRVEAVETFNEDFIWNKGTKPQADRAYDYISQRVAEDTRKITSQFKRDAAWTIGTAAAVGAVTYGLYRWATRRGLGGLANDFKAMDSKFAGALNQIDEKYTALKLKGKKLTKTDESLARGLSILIESKIHDWEKKLEILDFKHNQLKKIIEPIIPQQSIKNL